MQDVNNEYLYNKNNEKTNLEECQYFDVKFRKFYEENKAKGGKSESKELCELCLTSTIRGMSVFTLKFESLPVGLPNMTKRSLYNRGLLLFLKDGICPVCSGAMKSVRFEQAIDGGLAIENEVGCPNCKFRIIETEDYTRY
jgi:hypothetical protein